MDTIMGNTMENKWEMKMVLMDEQMDFYNGNDNG